MLDMKRYAEERGYQAFGFKGLSVTDKLQQDGVAVDGTRQTLGFVELGTGFVLSRRLFFTLFTDVGITADAPDFIIGASLPTRF